MKYTKELKFISLQKPFNIKHSLKCLQQKFQIKKSKSLKLWWRGVEKLYKQL